MTYADDLIATSNRGRIKAGDRVEVRMFRRNGDGLVELWRPATCHRTPVGGVQGVLVEIHDGWIMVALRSQVRRAA